jgi:hypothetical protein
MFYLTITINILKNKQQTLTIRKCVDELELMCYVEHGCRPAAERTAHTHVCFLALSNVRV